MNPMEMKSAETENFGGMLNQRTRSPLRLMNGRGPNSQKLVPYELGPNP